MDDCLINKMIILIKILFLTQTVLDPYIRRKWFDIFHVQEIKTHVNPSNSIIFKFSTRILKNSAPRNP